MTPDQGAVERFEEEFARTFEAKYALAFPYGRSALWALLNALNIHDAEIILPAYTCAVVAHAIVLSGNSPRFVDINLHDYNMDLDQVAETINQRTKAIIATHLFGYPLNVDRLTKIVREAEHLFGHKIWVIQDCAHSFGAEWQGKQVCIAGDAALYGLNISKVITSIFGGMITTSDENLYNKIKKYRDAHFKKYGFVKTLCRLLYIMAVYPAFNERLFGLVYWLQEHTPLLNRLTKAYHLDDKIHFPPDYLDQMLPIEARVGLVQLKKYPEIVEKRREAAAFYDQNLPAREGWIKPPLVNGATYSHYVVRVPNRDACIMEMAAKGVHLGELIQYSVPNMNSYLSTGGSFPNAYLASKTTINIPLHKYKEIVHKISLLPDAKMRETDFLTKEALEENDVIAFYDAYAPFWDDRFGNNYATNYFLERRWKSFVDVLNRSQVSKSTVIELGVGTGIYIERVSKIFEKIIALDGSQKMLDVLEKKISAQNINNISTIRANVVDLHPVDAASVDCVYFFGLIEHVIDTHAFMTEIKRILRKGGCVIGITPNKRSPWYKLRNLIRGTGKHCSSDKYYSIDELDKMFETHGFHKVCAIYWGTVPAGINESLAKLLAMLEPIMNKLSLSSYLGGITFSYRR